MKFLPPSFTSLTPVSPLTASLAIVKSRDMHWGLMAQKEHKGINLGSLRMLLVADGANPCKLTHSSTFMNGSVLQNLPLKALFNNVSTLKNLRCVSLHVSSVFDHV